MRSARLLLLFALVTCHDEDNPQPHRWTIEGAASMRMIGSWTFAWDMDPARPDRTYTICERCPDFDPVDPDVRQNALRFDTPVLGPVMVKYALGTPRQADGSYSFPLVSIVTWDGADFGVAANSEMWIDPRSNMAFATGVVNGAVAVGAAHLGGSVTLSSDDLRSDGTFVSPFSGNANSFSIDQLWLNMRDTRVTEIQTLMLTHDGTLTNPYSNGVWPVGIPVSPGTDEVSVPSVEMTGANPGNTSLQFQVDISWRFDARIFQTNFVFDTVAEVRAGFGPIQVTAGLQFMEGTEEAEDWQQMRVGATLQQTGPISAITLAGANGWVIADAVTGALLNTTFRTAQPNPAGTTYGVVPLSDAPDHAFLAFGAWGASIARYDFQLDDFEPAPLVIASDNITDAFSWGDEALFVDNTNNFIGFVERVLGGWDLSPTRITSARFPGATGNVISACRTDDGGILFLTDGEPGQLWFVADPSAATPATLLGGANDLPRRVRSHGDVAVFSFFGGAFSFGGIAFVRRTGVDWSITGFSVLAGRAVGIDIKELQNGDLAVAATDFDNDTYTVTVVSSTADFVSHDLFDVPIGCTQPGHVLWLDDAACSLVVTCNGSGDAYVIPADS